MIILPIFPVMFSYSYITFVFLMAFLFGIIFKFIKG